MSDEYRVMMAELINRLGPEERAWFAQIQTVQDLTFELLKVPWWMPWRRLSLQRRLLEAVALSQQLYRQTRLDKPGG
jgi:hypothetical protein